MQRFPDWQSRLAACIAERMDKPAAWGSQDCALFAADCVAACTGVDPAEGTRGTYTDAMSAARVVRELGGLAAVAAARLGEEVPPLMAQPGDVGLVMSDGRECLAVCTGPTWHAPGLHGLQALPVDAAHRAWRLLKSSEN